MLFVLTFVNPCYRVLPQTFIYSHKHRGSTVQSLANPLPYLPIHTIQSMASSKEARQARPRKSNIVPTCCCSAKAPSTPASSHLEATPRTPATPAAGSAEYQKLMSFLGVFVRAEYLLTNPTRHTTLPVPGGHYASHRH